MFEQFKIYTKTAIGAALTVVARRFEPVEADVATLKSDFAAFKSFMEGLQSGELPDLTAEIADFGKTKAAVGDKVDLSTLTPALIKSVVASHASLLSTGGDALAAATSAGAGAGLSTATAGALASMVDLARTAHDADGVSGTAAVQAATDAAIGAGADSATASTVATAVAAQATAPQLVTTG